MEWKKVKLGELITIKNGKDHKNLKDGIYPVYGSGGVMRYVDNYLYDKESILLPRKGTLNNIQYAKSPFWTVDTCYYSVVNTDKVVPFFLFCALKQFNISALNTGSAIPSMTFSKYYSLDISLPPLPYQRRISSILSDYDSLIENYQRQISLLEESAKRIYKEWFVDFKFPGVEMAENGLPKGWQKKKLGEICETTSGGTPSTANDSYYKGGTIKWVTPTDITRSNSLCILDTDKKITEDGLKHSAAKMLPSETILMTSRASVGYFGLFDCEVCTNQGFISCIPNNPNLQMYLLYNLMNRVDEIRQNAGGTTYKEISKSTFRNFDILIPNDKVLVQYQDIAHTLIDKIRNCANQIRLLRQNRDILLPRLMNGEIEVEG